MDLQQLPHTIVVSQRADPAALMDAIVDDWEGQLRKRLNTVAPRPLGLATGRTMELFYAALVRRLQQWSGSDLERLRSGWLSFNLDEYVGLSSTHANSFAFYMKQRLADPLGLLPEQLHLPDGAAAQPDLEARRYSQELQRAGGIGLQLLGLGGNGHIGFNEPPCGADAPCRCVQLCAATREQNAAAFGGVSDQVPARAITLGIAEILAAQELHLIVTGATKTEILRRVFANGCDPSLPASWLLRHPRVRLWVDDAALGLR